jgi:hypothetical protein
MNWKVVSYRHSLRHRHRARECARVKSPISKAPLDKPSLLMLFRFERVLRKFSSADFWRLLNFFPVHNDLIIVFGNLCCLEPFFVIKFWAKKLTIACWALLSLWLMVSTGGNWSATGEQTKFVWQDVLHSSPNPCYCEPTTLSSTLCPLICNHLPSSHTL